MWIGPRAPNRAHAEPIERAIIGAMTAARTPKARTKSPAGDPFGARLKKLRSELRKLDADHMVVSNPRDVAYLTGFLGGDSYLVVGRGKPTMISDSRYEEELGGFKRIVKVRMRTALMSEAVGEELVARRPDRIAIQGEHMTLNNEIALKKALRKRSIAARSLVRTDSVLLRLRAVKDASEIRLLQRAIRIQEAALVATLPQIRVGMTELELCAILEHEMKDRGSPDPSFETIVGARANSSLPHYTPGATKVGSRQTLLIDWGATWKGYHGDMTRTFGIGGWPARVREIYKIVLEAHEAAASALRPGLPCLEADRIAREIISKAGYSKQFGHGLGHGIGLDIHELPSMGARSPRSALLEVGNVVTIEPGIYLPGIGGVRLEDDYVITERGAKNLSSLAKDLAWATRR